MRKIKRTERWVYCSVDYSALEMCTLAQCCVWLFEQSAMADQINAGRDLHVFLASQFLGIDYEEGVARRKAKEPNFINLRQAAKPVNFGLGGLMGVPKLVFTARKDGVRFCELLRGCTCGTEKTVRYKGRAIAPTCVECLSIAEDLKAAYFSAYPEVSRYHEVTIATADECADGIPLESFGTGMKRLETGASAVSNHFFQNLAAQGAKRALYVLSKEAYTNEASTLFNRVRPVVFVHDEVICEIREDEALHANAWRMAEIMRTVMQTVTPDVKISAEPALMRRWFKGAELVTSKTGEAKPWWPKDWAWGPDQATKARDSAA